MAVPQPLSCLPHTAPPVHAAKGVHDATSHASGAAGLIASVLKPFAETPSELSMFWTTPLPPHAVH
jgi:hypothetical protein